MAKGRSSPRIKSVERALAVLRLFRSPETVLTLQDIAKQAGIPLTSTYRFVGQLVASGFLQESLTGEGFLLGPEILRLGSLYPDWGVLRRVARPVMERLSRESEESVVLAVRQNDAALAIESVESRHAVRLAVAVGERLPLVAGASGKLILAYAPPEEIEELVARASLVRVASRTPLSRRLLRQQLKLIRAQGYAVTESEVHEGARGISAPVRGPGGRVVAAVTLSGVAFRMADHRIPRLAELVVRAAQDISHRLAIGQDAAAPRPARRLSGS